MICYEEHFVLLKMTLWWWQKHCEGPGSSFKTRTRVVNIYLSVTPCGFSELNICCLESEETDIRDVFTSNCPHLSVSCPFSFSASLLYIRAKCSRLNYFLFFCRPCECDLSGSVGDCSALDGRCYCKQNVEGQNCNRLVIVLLFVSQIKNKQANCKGLLQ